MTIIGVAVGKWFLCKHLKADRASLCCWASALRICVHIILTKPEPPDMESNNIHNSREGLKTERADEWESMKTMAKWKILCVCVGGLEYVLPVY